MFYKKEGKKREERKEKTVKLASQNVEYRKRPDPMLFRMKLYGIR